MSASKLQKLVTAATSWLLAVLSAALLAACAGSSPDHPSAASRKNSVVQPSLGIAVNRQGGNCQIHLSGPLDDYAAHQLRYVMSELDREPCLAKRVILGPSGGVMGGEAGASLIGSAISLGTIIKNRGYDTQLAAGTTCLTPCLLVFAAGRQRIMLAAPPPARLGFSRLPPDADFGRGTCATEPSAAQAQTLTRYLRAMLPPDTASYVYRKLSLAHCLNTDYLDAAKAQAVGLASPAP